MAGNNRVDETILWPLSDQLTQPCMERSLARLTRYLSERAGDPGVAAVDISNHSVARFAGRLSARLQTPDESITTLKSIPNEADWHVFVQAYFRSQVWSKKSFAQFQQVLQATREKIRTNTTTWAVAANTMLDYGQWGECVKWTSDWASRTDATPRQLISPIASRWDVGQIHKARKIIERARTIPADSASSIIHVWSAFDALVFGNYSFAHAEAQRVDVNQLSGWYPAAYSLLVSALESLPASSLGMASGGESTASSGLSRREVLERVRGLTPAHYPMPTEFKQDRLTKWLMMQAAAHVARAHGLVLTSWYWQACAFLSTWR